MKAGRLTEEITIERAANTVNAAGTPVLSWSPVCTLRAEKVEESTVEYIRNFGASDEQLAVFRTRFFEGITNADRLIWQGDPFNIKEVARIGRRKGLELRCVRLS